MSLLKKLGKPLLPFILGAGLSFNNPFSFSNIPPQLELKKYFDYSEEFEESIPTDIVQLSDGSYLIAGQADMESDPTAHDEHIFFTQLSNDLETQTNKLILDPHVVYSSGFVDTIDNGFAVSANLWYWTHCSSNLIKFSSLGDVLLNKPYSEVFADEFAPTCIMSGNTALIQFDDEYNIVGGNNFIKLDSEGEIVTGWPRTTTVEDFDFPNGLFFNGNLFFTKRKPRPGRETYFFKTDLDGNELIKKDLQHPGNPIGKIYVLDDNSLFFSSNLELQVQPNRTKYNSALFRLDLNGNPYPGWPIIFNRDYNDFVSKLERISENEFLLPGNSYSDNPYEGKFTLKKVTSDAEILWEIIDSSNNVTRINKAILNSDNEIIAVGYELSENEEINGLILKFYPESQKVYQPLGFDNEPFEIGIDNFAFPNWLPTLEDVGNDFLESLKTIIELNGISSAKDSLDIEERIEEYLPLAVTYVEYSLPSNDFGMSALANYLFENQSYGSEGNERLGVHSLELTSELRRSIRREHRKLPYVRFARNVGILSNRNKLEDLIDITSDKDTPAILICENSTSEHPVLAYSVEDGQNTAKIKIYDSNYLDLELTAQINKQDDSFSYFDYEDTFVFDSNWLYLNSAILNAIDVFKEKYLEDLVRQGLDLFVLFPYYLPTKDLEQLEYLIVDENGNRHGYENGNYFQEISGLTEKQVGGVFSLTIPSDLEYSISFSDVPSATTNLSLVNSGTNEQETRTWYGLPIANQDSVYLSSRQNNLEITSVTGTTSIPPTHHEQNISFYDFNADSEMDYLDLFSLSNSWKEVSSPSNYNQDFLLKMIENKD